MTIPTEPDTPDTLDLRLPPPKVDAIHRALLSGLLGNIATRSTSQETPNEYAAARGAKVSIFPGSGLFKRKPAWFMAAEIAETTKIYARTIAPIQPQWAERLGEHLIKRTYTEPHYQDPPNPSAYVVAFEKVTLFGLTLVPRRSVHYGPIAPEVSRQLFIHHALVLGEYRSAGEFDAHNRKLIEDIRTLEAKRRQRDLLVDEQALYDFYDRRLPPGIYNGPLFEKWRQHVERGRPTVLFLHRRDLLKHEVEENKTEYPDTIDVAGASLSLSYAFDPSDPADGVTATLPLALLNQVPPQQFEWLVPGLLHEKVIALTKTMPKPLRVRFVPVPTYAQQAVKALRSAPGLASLHDALAHVLGKISGEPMDRRAFTASDLPPYLLMNFRIVDDAGETVATGRDLEQLRRRLGAAARQLFQSVPPPRSASATAPVSTAGPLSAPEARFHRDGIISWDLSLDLPERVEIRRNGMTLQGFPALVDAGENAAALRLFDSVESARLAQRGGVRRLLMLQLREEIKSLSGRLPGFERMALLYSPLASPEQLKADLVDAIVDRALFGDDAGHDADPVRTREEFLSRAQRGWRRLNLAATEITGIVGKILDQHHALDLELGKVAPPLLIASYQDMRRHLSSLVYPGFIRTTPPAWLGQLPRFLDALKIRLRKLHGAGLKRDEAALRELAPFQVRMEEANRGVVSGPWSVDSSQSPALDDFRWMLEELRVSLFAQELKTSIPVSVKRLEEQWQKATLVRQR